MRFSAIKELKKYEFNNLQLAIEKRESAIATKNRKIQSLTKRLDKLRLKRDKLARELGNGRSAKYIAVLAEIRKNDADLKFCINWVKQKTQALDAKKAADTPASMDASTKIALYVAGATVIAAIITRKKA